AISSGISENHKQRITGEALLVRTMVHFYLSQLFGDIPYVTGTDYRINTRIDKTDWSVLYRYLISDGERAFSLLKEQPAVNNTAVNKFTVAAFMSRLHLYGEDRKSTRLNSSYVKISYAVFCLK